MIKVGEYIRTPWGQIGKVRQIATHKPYFDDGFYIEDAFVECGRKAMKEIENSYPNIIDLLSPQDLMFIDISPDNEGGIIVPRIAETLNELNVYKEAFKNGDAVLKGIVTKEQIQLSLYKVGDKQ